MLHLITFSILSSPNQNLHCYDLCFNSVCVCKIDILLSFCHKYRNLTIANMYHQLSPTLIFIHNPLQHPFTFHQQPYHLQIDLAPKTAMHLSLSALASLPYSSFHFLHAYYHLALSHTSSNTKTPTHRPVWAQRHLHY